MNYKPFKLISFDTYGTLIDWETGIVDALRATSGRCNPPPGREEVLQAFGEAEFWHETQSPTLLYRHVLEAVFKTVAEKWGVAVTERDAADFGRSVKHWPAYTDSPAALNFLRRHFRIVTLTNCDRISYMGSNARLEVEWDAIYTAEDIGSYKPAQRNFDYLLQRARADFGVLPHEILHVAQSLTHDMVPATRAGLSKVWINRRHAQQGFGATVEPGTDYVLEAQFNSMADFVADVATNLGV